MAAQGAGDPARAPPRPAPRHHPCARCAGRGPRTSCASCAPPGCSAVSAVRGHTPLQRAAPTHRCARAVPTLQWALARTPPWRPRPLPPRTSLPRTPRPPTRHRCMARPRPPLRPHPAHATAATVSPCTRRPCIPLLPTAPPLPPLHLCMVHRHTVRPPPGPRPASARTSRRCMRHPRLQPPTTSRRWRARPALPPLAHSARRAGARRRRYCAWTATPLSSARPVLTRGIARCPRHTTT